jgi:hypothetical protein
MNLSASADLRAAEDRPGPAVSDDGTEPKNPVFPGVAGGSLNDWRLGFGVIVHRQPGFRSGAPTGPKKSAVSRTTRLPTQLLHHGLGVERNGDIDT